MSLLHFSSQHFSFQNVFIRHQTTWFLLHNCNASVTITGRVFLPWFPHSSESKVLATLPERGNKPISFLGLSPHVLYLLPFSGFTPRKAETQFPAVKEIHSRSFVKFSQCFTLFVFLRLEYNLMFYLMCSDNQ